MHRSVVLIVASVLALAASSAAGEPTLTQHMFLGGKLSLLVPESFAEMGDERLRIKYPSERRPTTVLTNPDGSINVAVNHTQNSVQPGQLPEAHAVIDRTFRNMYPAAEWTRSEVVSINGRQFFVLELRTPATDTEILNIIGGTSFEGRLLLISFNCIRKSEGQWVEVGRRILHSTSLTK